LEDNEDAETTTSEDYLPHLEWWEEARQESGEEKDKMLKEQEALEQPFMTKTEIRQSMCGKCSQQ
jgi:hypothetical protein